MNDQDQNPICVTCHTPLSGQYCSHCGEKVIDHRDYSMLFILQHFFETVFDFDRNIFQSFYLLIRKPGFLTKEYLRGKRKTYLSPLRMFMIANVIYFFVQPFTLANGFNTPLNTQCYKLPYSNLAKKIIAEKIEETWISYDRYESVFNRQTTIYAKTLIFLMVPMLALVMKGLNFRKRRYYSEHIIFALHFYTFYMFWIFVVTLSIHKILYLVLLHLQWIDLLNILTAPIVLEITIFVFLALYIYSAQRQIYREKWPLALMKGVLGFLFVYIVTDIYRFILFFLTFYTVNV